VQTAHDRGLHQQQGVHAECHREAADDVDEVAEHLDGGDGEVDERAERDPGEHLRQHPEHEVGRRQSRRGVGEERRQRDRQRERHAGPHPRRECPGVERRRGQDEPGRPREREDEADQHLLTEREIQTIHFSFARARALEESLTS
jgi:hypothetical protein